MARCLQLRGRRHDCEGVAASEAVRRTELGLVRRVARSERVLGDGIHR
jgi:hypothetical protein